MIFIAGGSGGLGRYLMDNIASQDRVGTYYSKQYKDTLFYDFSKDAKIIEEHYKDIDAVISTVALTDVDFSERNPDKSYQITFNSCKNIVDACRKFDIPFLFVSTNDVFDGVRGLYDEDATPSPINYYSIHKLMAEEYVKNNLDDYMIIRASLLETYSSFKSSTLISNIFDSSKTGKELRLFKDSFNSPVHISTISDILLNRDLWDSAKTIHVCSDRVSKYDLGIFSQAILNKKLSIEPISIDDFDFFAKRPKDVSLISKFDLPFKTDIEKELRKVYKEWLNE